MKLVEARVQNYRSIRDTGRFEIEKMKTILVGPNEAGKSAVLQALQQINPPADVKNFDALRDYPRDSYNEISSKNKDPKTVPVVTGWFELDDEEKQQIPDIYQGLQYEFTRYLDNHATHTFVGQPPIPTYSEVKSGFLRFAKHLDEQLGTSESSESLTEITKGLYDFSRLTKTVSTPILAWLESHEADFDEDNEKESERFKSLSAKLIFSEVQDRALKYANDRLPTLVLFNNYFRVRPNIHLGRLASRIEGDTLEDDWYDYGNKCLLSLLGFSARELSDFGAVAFDDNDDQDEFEEVRDKLDERKYQLNAASIKLTREIRSIWKPDPQKPEADRLRIEVDGQYMKLVVEDDLGVEIELDQRSEGFQWLVSFFTVFFAEAEEQHENAILLLDEPGMSLHALKQREFRHTLSRLAENNQTLFTTHSPFLIGPDELDIVRVVEMPDRLEGTKVHTTISSSDSAAILPLQEALGYDLASTLFSAKRNVVLEGLTDYWYLQASSELLNAFDGSGINENISLLPASNAGKVVYFATILHTNDMKVAALLDSDAAGDAAAEQETLIHLLGNNGILRTLDFMPDSSKVKRPEIEDLFRTTLLKIMRDEFGCDVVSDAQNQKGRPIVDLFEEKSSDFSKYKLAKAFVRWSRDNSFNKLTPNERNSVSQICANINKFLK